MLPAVTVTATRTPRAVEETPGTVSVIGEEEIERELARDIEDLVRHEPGVMVRTDPNRYGNGGFNIRGIDGNRVAIQVDGVRVPDQLTGTIPLTRDYVDLYLARFGRPWYASGKGAYYSSSETWAETVTLAGRAGPLDALLLFTRRDGHETENNGAIPANPKDIVSSNLLGKLVWRAGESSTFRLTGEFFERDTETDVASDRTATLLARLAEEETRRSRVSLAHEYRDAGAGLVQGVRWQLYYQDGETRDTAEERRIVGGSERLRPIPGAPASTCRTRSASAPRSGARRSSPPSGSSTIA
ncbi:MAG TPA: TonB-dependent receptor plug domain-containing protein [Thermodesulfobacteriota bacterium]